MPERPPVRTIRKFDEMLGLLSRGKFAEKCDEALTHAIETLEQLPGEKGKATITLKIELAYQNGRLDINPDVKSKLPEGDKFSATPFWTYEGGLSVQHPSQIDMFAGPRVATKNDREREAV
jgi:hypothetical protein